MKSPFNRRAASALADPGLQEALQVATSRFGDLRKQAFDSTAAPLALRALPVTAEWRVRLPAHERVVPAIESELE